MTRYIIRRLLLAIPVLVMVTVLVFALIELAPGDVVDFFAKPEVMAGMSEADLEALRERLGLNDPAPVRYLHWLGGVLQGDFGYSLIRSEPVGELLLRRFGNSMMIMGIGLFVAVTFGISLGIYTALRQYSVADFTISFLSFVGISMPAFIAGILALYIFSVQLGWFPAGGMRSPGVHTLGDLLHHLILPALVLSIIHMATFMRYTRFSMLDVLKQEYVVTATAKGMPRRIVVMRHAFRNGLIPVVTMIGYSIPELVVGAVFLETIFSFPGMGKLYFDSVISRDFPVIMAANLVIAVFVLAANLITDVAYAAIDPRIRLE